MKYVCVDRGSQRCPCHLMAAGQCYTCTMIRDGVCGCDAAAGWQGVCPYAEYLQLGGDAACRSDAARGSAAACRSDAARGGACGPSDCVSPLRVLSKIHYGGGLYLVQLAASTGFAESCRQPGAYVMAEALGWRTPLSVLRAERVEEHGRQRGTVELLVKDVGPKTRALLEDGEPCWNVAGPYFNGLLNAELLREDRPIFAIARGTAAAPLVHLLENLQQGQAEQESAEGQEGQESQPQQMRLYLDDEALPVEFTEGYLTGYPYEKVRLGEEEQCRKLQQELKQILNSEKTGSEPGTGAAGWNVLLLVSPYFREKLMEGLSEKERAGIIIPNPANLCCGMGICGACSHTDADGVTVRLCKCSRSVIE